MTATEVADVLVIGGGPAGAVGALALAKLGRRVILCEAEPFPRDHIGISLSPGLATQLDFLGVGAVLQHRLHQSHLAVEQRWGSETLVTVPHLEAFIADRAVLDADLLAAAGERGVRILQPARVGHLEREARGWSVSVSTGSGPRRIRCRFALDAGGRGSRFRHRRRRGAATVAVCGTWTGDVRPVMRIAAAPDSWSWTAPTGPHRRMAVAFTNPETLRLAGGSLEARYRRLLDDAGVLEPDLALATGLYACAATAYVVEGNVDDLLRIGDADAALDPLSSCGVQAAVQSALCAAPVVNTLLSSNGDRVAALEYWAARRAARAAGHQAWAAARYAEAFACHGTDFWRARATPVVTPTIGQSGTPLPAPDQLVQLSSRAAMIRAPCLVDEMVTRAECLIHPSLTEPVAYVDGLRLHPLLAELRGQKPAQAVVAAWAATCAPVRALALMQWLWRREIIVAG